MSTAFKTPKRTLGDAGEAHIANKLEARGFTILARNYTVRGGEVDIIALKDELLLFIEVKTRTRSDFALSEVITPSKQKKIIFAARYFLATNSISDKVYRFDVALVEGSNKKITYIPNAFTNWQQYS